MVKSFLIAVFCSLGFMGCSWQPESKPSVLVIAVDHLGVQDISCQESVNENEASGLQFLCRESVRFTHAYSNSPMAQSALASLLTGLSPDSHGVLHNGNQYLSAKLETSMEKAVAKGFRTAFFSGGPPIWSKSGMRQGFEVFDDNIGLGLGKIYRPAHENFHLFLSWLDDIGDDERFLSVIYVPDLGFPNYSTNTESGEARKRSVEGQIQEIDESLEFLYRELFKRKRWNNTNLVLVGLSGHEQYSFREYFPSENLFSENTQIGLLIKPARKNPEQGGNWKIDKNVSIADVGYSLFELIGERGPEVDKNKVQSISLLEALASPQVSWPEERPLLAGTGWPAWMRWGDNKFIIRSGYFLILLKQPITLFNTLTDRLENSGQVLSPNYWPAFIADISQKSVAQDLQPWKMVPKELVAKIKIVPELFINNDASEELKTRIENGFTDGRYDQQVLSWAALKALQLGDWPWLLKLSEFANKEVWKLIARRGLGEKADWHQNSCLSLLEKKRADIVYQVVRLCDEPMFADLILWMKSKDLGSDVDMARDTFIREFQSLMVAREIGINNYLSYLSWDVDVAVPGGPTYSELVLYLPENKNLLGVLKKRLPYKN